MNLDKMLYEFNKAAGNEKPGVPQIPNKKTIALHRKLIKEECIVELNKAFRERNIVDIADALADGVYVLFDTAWSCGIKLQPILEEVHRSNMTKCVNGKMRRRQDGKILKPKGYEKPNIADEIMKQAKRGRI